MLGVTHPPRMCTPTFILEPFMTRTGLEPMLPPWKGGVLTTWPTGHIKGAVKMLRLCLVAAPGFEPGTLRVWTECSSQLSYAAMYCLNSRVILSKVFCLVNSFFPFCAFLLFCSLNCPFCSAIRANSPSNIPNKSRKVITALRDRWCAWSARAFYSV